MAAGCECRRKEGAGPLQPLIIARYAVLGKASALVAALFGGLYLGMSTWLLTQKAVETGEIKSAGGRRPERRLGHANDSDPAVVGQLPESAQRLINASTDLYSRIQRLDEGQLLEEPAPSPARALMGRLERDLIWNRNG